MKDACCEKQNAGSIARRLLLSGVLLVAIGCDSGADPAVERVQFPEGGGELILTEDEPASGGVMTVTLEIAPPDDIDFPDNLGVANALQQSRAIQQSKADSDIHFEAQIRYAKALLGARKVGEFVPYLNVQATITNRDNGKQINTTLVPHVGIAEGYHYGRNLALVATLGASEAGYDAEVTITQPTPAGSAAATAISPGTVMQSDIAGEVVGTLLGTTPTVVRGGFILGDFKEISTEKMGQEAPSAPAEEVYMY